MQAKQKSRGVLLIACGHENYIGMALNLAASIRVTDPGLAIALATDKPRKAEYIPSFFDDYVQIESGYITVNNQPAFIKAKVYMNELTPYEETIFLDADTVMLPHGKLSKVFDELKDVAFTMSNTGPAGDVSIWCDIAEARSKYPGEFWNFHSEFVYFKKSAKQTKDFFKAAQSIYAGPKIKSAVNFGGAPMADELAFQLAAMKTGIYPHRANWLPNFWYARDKKQERKYPYQLTDKQTYSIGGAQVPSFVKQHYQNLVEYFYKKAELGRPQYFIKDKRTFLQTRKKI